MTEDYDWQLIHPRGGKALWVIATRQEIEDYRSISLHNCEHPTSELRDYETSNGGWQRKEQCLNCGKAVSNPVKRDRNLEVPKWDANLESEYLKKRAVKKSEIENHLIERTANLETEGYVIYEEYLDSADWKKRRSAALARDGGLCQACYEADASEVHHLTYERIFEEPLFDLVSVCEDCHKKLHRRNIAAKEAGRAKGLL